MASVLRSLHLCRAFARSNMISPCRSFGTDVSCKKLVFREFGDPAKVVKLEEQPLRTPETDEVLIEMMISSMNPADMNTIQGTYPIKPELPGIPGNEGVGKIIAVGSSVKSLCAGDYVIPNTESLGTWRSHIVVKEQLLLKVPKDVPLVEMAGISSNTSTAYRMLKDFVHLGPGDSVIQNGANSAAGQNVIQLCKIWGIQSVNIVRNRPDIALLKQFLMDLGASHVLTEEELRTTTIFKDGTCPAPKLGLNCVGGKSASEVLRKLGQKGVMVTYGGMSREPVAVPTSLFIFKDVAAKGYWMTRWTRENRNSEVRQKMLEELMGYMKERKLVAPAHSLLPISDFKKALETTTNFKGFAGCKFLIDFRL